MVFLQSAAFRVGLLVSSIVALVAGMTIRVSEDPSSFGRSTRAWFVLEDASGIVKNSNVKMAGIPVGIVKDIKLYEGHARLDLVLTPDIKLSKNARVAVRTTGILGDRYIEIVKGDESTGILDNDSQIFDVRTSGSLDGVVDDISKLSKSLLKVSESLREATSGEGDRTKPLARILDNVERLSEDLADLSEGNRDRLDDIISNVQDITENLKHATSDTNVKRIDRALANIEEITDKVNKGKGTIGKLVNDEKTVDELNTAIVGVNKFLDTASKIQTSLDLKSEYLTQQGLYKTSLGVRIKPGLDRYYEIGIVDDPKGVVERTSDRVTTNAGTPAEATTTTNESKTFKDKIKFNALFAKNFYDLTIKGGLMESSGGVGLDYYLFRRHLRLSLEAFDFDPNNGIHMRAFGRLNVYHGIYLTGGSDDFSSRVGNQSTFIGAGLDFTNDDLKFLLAKAPF